VGPRWAPNKKDIYYTGFLQRTPLVYRLDVASGSRSLLAQFKGLATGAAVSPDGKSCAIVLSYQGNPELYVIDMASGRWVRMTNTPLASEGQPAWSPDGRKIVYVSDETRHPQLYVIDVATKQKRRLTSKGSQNVDPDWGSDGRITYITKRGGAQIAVMDPSAGEASAKLVTAPGNWEHPSWSRDARNIVASRDRALFVVDTEMQNDMPNKPTRVFFAEGSWITPSWSR
jgi:TolB protein